MYKSSLKPIHTQKLRRTLDWALVHWRTTFKSRSEQCHRLPIQGGLAVHTQPVTAADICSPSWTKWQRSGWGTKIDNLTDTLPLTFLPASRFPATCNPLSNVRFLLHPPPHPSFFLKKPIYPEQCDHQYMPDATDLCLDELFKALCHQT